MGTKEIQMIILYILMPVIGIAIILFALIRGRSLGQKTIEIGLSKLGLDLKLDTLTFLVLVGFVMAASGGILLYQDYENQITQGKKSLEQKSNEINNLKSMINQFKAYAMLFHLKFPESDKVETNNVKVQAYISKHGIGPPRLYDTKPSVDIFDDVWITIDYLNPGDKLRIVAYEGKEKSWESSSVVEIPKTRLDMKRVK